MLSISKRFGADEIFKLTSRRDGVSALSCCISISSNQRSALGFDLCLSLIALVTLGGDSSWLGCLRRVNQQ